MNYSHCYSSIRLVRMFLIKFKQKGRAYMFYFFLHFLQTLKTELSNVIVIKKNGKIDFLRTVAWIYIMS